ncbi:1-deoxy-D-xylulose-5-phosphate reductoisomerase [candidate division LCP-89 bacterium B3_LCP]|uniref:1-deoxy-D-xylulose 5-phosphate reductoisomerase n=1 Tax=candidate division LCP-89 bacterium B3_LCP TaxID=2012998 RepID=A0A532UXY3_UNCL8|nr:MAG: 1-deoxy-D-xylulose-5-phosphate reductoisomerase [candidate division LCP-89 bacterium B3_LCP]
MKNIAILGSTGSIGRNTLDVIEQLGDDFNVYGIAARTQIERLAQQVVDHNPRLLALADESDVGEIRSLIGDNKVEIITGEKALTKIAQDPEVDVVVNALVGAIGLKATLAALEAGKTVALANKESIVMAGPLVMVAAANNDGLLIPIDSEHSAVLQCFRGENPGQVNKLILTASGGPFRDTPKEKFPYITPEQALEHPNWDMGPKITIDSASMMNKGLEVIEAHYLFNLQPERIQVVIHPQSVIHSMVEFVDGSIKAQLSLPDMRIPIQYSLTYPDRISAQFVANDLVEIGSLQFEAPDLQRFPCLKLAYDALDAGIGYPTVLNAANEVAVEAFLSRNVTFDRIPVLIEKTLQNYKPPALFDLDAVLKADRWGREWAYSLIK